MDVDELAKSIVRSGLIEAFQIDYVAGNIIIKSSAGVSAELYYALGIWDFYDKESAIERAVIAQMKGLAEEQTNKLEIPDLASGNTVLKDLAKQVTDKALKNIDNEFFGGLYGDKIAFTMSHGENIANLLDGNISGRQFMKNTVLGFMTTAVTMSALSILPISGGILGFLQVYGIKSKTKEKLKNILDSFIEDDDKRMVKIFNRVLTEELQGKVLTKYELEFLNETIIGNFNKEFIREMLEQDKDTEREAFVRKHIHKSFGRAFRHRIFVKMPTEKDWQDGLARVKRRIETGEDLFSEMNAKRDKNLALWKEQQEKEEQATELYMNFKFSQAVPLLKELADKGNMRASYMLISGSPRDDYIKDLIRKNIQAGDVCTIFYNGSEFITEVCEECQKSNQNKLIYLAENVYDVFAQCEKSILDKMIYLAGKNDYWEFERIYTEEFKKSNLNKLIYLAENLYDVFAQWELANYYGYMYHYEPLAFKYLHMAAEQDYVAAFGALSIGYCLRGSKYPSKYGGRYGGMRPRPNEEEMKLFKESLYWARKLTKSYKKMLSQIYEAIYFKELFYAYGDGNITKYHKWFEENLVYDITRFPELSVGLKLYNLSEFSPTLYDKIDKISREYLRY